MLQTYVNTFYYWSLLLQFSACQKNANSEAVNCSSLINLFLLCVTFDCSSSYSGVWYITVEPALSRVKSLPLACVKSCRISSFGDTHSLVFLPLLGFPSFPIYLSMSEIYCWFSKVRISVKMLMCLASWFLYIGFFLLIHSFASLFDLGRY